MTKKSGAIDYNVPLRLPIDGGDPEALFRRLIEFSYAVGRQYRADGGRADIEDAIRTAQGVADTQAMSHVDGGPGVIEKQDVKLREPLSGYEMTVGRLPKQTAPAVEAALQTASEIGPYFTPAAPLAAARDAAVGLREGNFEDIAMSAFGVPGKLGKLLKGAAVGSYALAPEEAEAGVIQKAMNAIRAYHGSPHTFDRFDMSKIGTGEGAQAYGHGLYFAENENIAKGYRDRLAKSDASMVRPDDEAVSKIKGQWDDIVARRQKIFEDTGGRPTSEYFELSDMLDALNHQAVQDTVARKPYLTQGSMYEVNIQANPEHLLDWDRTLSGQSEFVKKALEKTGIRQDKKALQDFDDALLAALEDRGPSKLPRQPPDPLGANIYESGKLVPGSYRDPVAASQTLREIGIPGIKYLDAGSRGAGEGSRNYVIFDDNLIDILRRYAQGGEVEREDYDKGGSIIRAAMNALKSYKDPASKYIKDWNWRPLEDVQKDIGTSDVPEHVQNFGRYMGDISDKAATEGLDPEDVIKAYMITRSSIQREGRTPAKIASYGIPVREGAEGIVRPEGHMADFLSSPMGVKFLNEARKGDLSQDAVDAAVATMRPFGLSKVEPDAMDWARRNLPEQSANVSELVARAREGASSPDEWRAFTRGVRGVGPAKTGFLGSLLGRGDLPTLDARQAILHTGMKNAEAQDIMARNAGRAGHEAVDRLAARQRAMNFQMPEELDPFYQHLAHHTVWDAIGNEKTTHQDIIDAMKPRADGGEVEREDYAGGGSAIKNIINLAQKITSADTSIKQVPALLKSKHLEVMTPEHRNIDIGGGRFDLGTEYLRGRGVESHVLDPFNRPQEHNEEIIRRFSQDPAHSATIANVLNVIAEPEARRNVIQQARDLVAPGGKAYFGIYEGDRSGLGRATSKGWQENRPAASYEEEIAEMFPGLQRFGNIIIAPRREAGGEVSREDYDKGGGIIAKALMALHNMKSHRLDMAEKLGGLPVPSIAIANPEHGFAGFGDITLVGGKEMATPSKANPVFASDVYSPRFPSLDDEGQRIFRGFTPSGTRRYAPLTMENVVREMRGNVRGGEGYGYGAGSVRAAVTPQFKSLADVQAAREKIIPSEEFRPHKERANEMLFELADKFHPYSQYSNTGFGHAHSFAETLADVGRGRRSAWAQDYHEGLPDELKREAMDYLAHLKNMPTEYFEAKPQRAVNLSEFAGAVVPENIMRDVAPRLKNLGVREIVPFRPEETGGQQKALREFGGFGFDQGGSVIDDALDVISELPQAAE